MASASQRPDQAHLVSPPTHQHPSGNPEQGGHDSQHKGAAAGRRGRRVRVAFRVLLAPPNVLWE